MKTIEKIHKVPARQDFSFRANPFPKNSTILHNYHSDIRELSQDLTDKFEKQNILYKQHIFPSPNNIRLLQKIKKVILLRDPVEVVLAYRRGALRKVHNLLKGFSENLNEEEWIDKSGELGLLSDLERFCNEWKANADPNNTIFIEYRDLIKSPKETINRIESFYNLPLSQSDISLARERYSRRNKVQSYIFHIKRKFISGMANLIGFLNLKHPIKRLLTKDKSP